MVLTFLLQIVLPLVFLISIWRIRGVGRRAWYLNTIPMLLGLLFLFVIQPWYLLSAYLRWLWLLLALAAALRSFQRIDPLHKEAIPRSSLVVNSITGLSLAAMAFYGLWGYIPPGGGIELASPLKNGVFYVANGGDSPLINGHQVVYTQRYALDIVALNPLGSSKDLFSGDGLESYQIFGAPVYSPCAGQVTNSRDSLPDLPIGQRDRQRLAGNYVALDCGGVGVLLAHLQQGSVRVHPGQDVAEGQLLGQVGNSGNTSEPHLHIHAARNSSQPDLADGDPVVIRMEGDFLVRGELLNSGD